MSFHEKHVVLVPFNKLGDIEIQIVYIDNVLCSALAIVHEWESSELLLQRPEVMVGDYTRPRVNGSRTRSAKNWP